MTEIITTTNETHLAASTLLNDLPAIQTVAMHRSPVARFVGNEDIPNPPAPAWYVPATGDIYIHADEAGIDTATMADDGSLGADFNGHKTLGLLSHEAAHAAISEGIITAERKAPKHAALLTTFEEVRVENHVIRQCPLLRRALRASFTLVLSSVRDLKPSQTATVARAWALVHGRTLAGVATPTETKPLDEAARTLLGDDTVDTLGDLLQEVITLSLPLDTGRLLEICEEWVDLVGTEAGEDGGSGRGDDGCDAEPDGSGAKGRGKGKLKGGESPTYTSSDDDDDDAPDDDLGGGEPSESGSKEWSAGAADSISTEDAEAIAAAFEELVADREAAELTDAALKALEEQFADEWEKDPPSLVLTSSLIAAHEVFANERRSFRLSRTDPKPHHRQAVLEVSQVLSNLSLPAVSKVSKSMTLPPGRLRSREAVRASAERTMGAMVTAQPWRGTVRRHSVARPLVVGIATDTSGSMRWAERAVADFAYVYANAGHRIGARTAAVTFGDRVHCIAKPGEIMSHVVGKEASDSTESAEYALAALDGVLHLTTPSYAARLLIVVSDGILVKRDESERVTMWFDQMTKAGTHVLWLGSSAAVYGSAWVRKLAAVNPNITYVEPPKATGSPVVGFDALNRVVLDAIQHHIR